MLMIPHFEVKRVWVDQSDISVGCVDFSEVIDAAKEQLGFDELIGIVAVEDTRGNIFVLDVTMIPVEEADPVIADHVDQMIMKEEA